MRKPRKPWTDEQKAAHSKRLRAYWDNRKAPKSFWQKLLERIKGAL